jgi:ankyrin repeat protein
MKNIDEILKAVGSTAEFLFEGCASIHQIGCFGDTPLHIVCSWGDAEAVDTLIQAGADVNAIGEAKMTPLFSAVMGRSVDVVNLLLRAQADLAVENEDGNTALQYAQLLDNETAPIPTEIIELLRTDLL